VCASGGDRAIVITPAKGVFFCFAAREGGDLIALAAHIRKVDVKDAAAWLDGGTVPSKKEGSGNQVPPKGNSSLEPLAYLEHEHVAVEALGFAAEDAKALGISYCPKGIMRGTLAVPVRLEDGTLAGYIGITEAKLPPHGCVGRPSARPRALLAIVSEISAPVLALLAALAGLGLLVAALGALGALLPGFGGLLAIFGNLALIGAMFGFVVCHLWILHDQASP